jgi:hypothetical protein
MPGHSPSKKGVNVLMAGHPRLAMSCNKDVDGWVKARPSRKRKALPSPLSQRHTIRASFVRRDILQRTLGVP